MAIPDFQTIMLPLLKITGDGEKHRHGDVSAALAAQFDLSEAEINELLPSGRQARFDNRVAWARAYLKKAGLIENISRGIFHITEQGLALLKNSPSRIDIKFLMKYPGIQEWHKKSPRIICEDNKNPEDVNDGGNKSQTPLEALVASFQEIGAKLSDDLIEQIMKCSPKFFEELVIDLLEKMDYGGSRIDAGEVTGRTGDEGIDGVIKQGKLGLDIVYVQAKRWSNTVSAQEVHAFAGSLGGQKAQKGIMITTSQFTPAAKEFVEKSDRKIVLIDGERLAQLMIEHDIGVTKVQNYTVKRVDLDYFDYEQ
jgi:restriction system protein